MEKEAYILFYLPEKHWFNSLFRNHPLEPLFFDEKEVSFKLIHRLESISFNSKRKEYLCVFITKKTIGDLGLLKPQVGRRSLHFITNDHFIPLIFEAYKKFNPKSFSYWKDLDKHPLNLAIWEQIKSKSYTKTIVKQLDRHKLIDKIDYSLLDQLMIGEQIKDLPNILYISKSKLFRRKNRLKRVFNIEGKSDTALVIKAIEMGYLKVGH